MLKFFRIPFATSGDKAAVPDAVDVNGFVSYTAGYGFDYQRQKTDPAAKNIERDKMNEIFFDITSALAELQSRGVPDFITTALNGGAPYSYSQYSLVRYSGDLYLSLVAANTALPSDATKWALLPIPARLQAAFNTQSTAAGTADALTAAFTPAIGALPPAPGTLSLMVRAASANTTAAPTFSPDGLTAKPIVKGANAPLSAGDIAGAGHWLRLDFDPTLDKWVLQNPAKGITPGALLDAPQTFTKAQRGDVVALPATTGNVAFDFSLANNFAGQVTGAVTFTNGYTNAAEGQSGVIKVLQNGSTPYSWAFGTNWKHVGGASAIPPQTQTLGAKDEIVYYIEDDGTISFAVRSDVKS